MKTQKPSKKTSPKAKSFSLFRVFAASLFLFSLGVYLFTVNLLATKGYAMREAERTLSRLEEEKQELLVQQAELRSLYRVAQESNGEEAPAQQEFSDRALVRYVQEEEVVALVLPSQE